MTLANEEIESGITELEQILDRESRALTGPPTAKLADIALEKERILGSLGAINVQEDTVSRLDQQVLARLKRCRQLNEDNNLLLKQRLKVIRDVNQIVRDQTGRKSVELYDGGGNLVQPASGKALSEA